MDQEKGRYAGNQEDAREFLENALTDLDALAQEFEEAQRAAERVREALVYLKNLDARLAEQANDAPGT